MTPLNTNQVINHLFLLTLLSNRRADHGALFDKVMATVERQPEKEKTYNVEVRVNGVELDFNDFTAKVHEQLDELVINAARALFDKQFAERFRTIASKVEDAERHAKDLCSALENEVRKAEGMSARQDEDD